MAAPITGRSPNPIDVHVGSRVRLRRMMVNMSQEKLGDRLGLTFQQIQKYEKGANRIGASRLYTIAQILGVSVQFFFDDMAPEVCEEGTYVVEGLEEAPQAAFVMNFVASAEGVQLNTAFSQIENAHVRRRLVDLARTLADVAAPAG